MNDLEQHLARLTFQMKRWCNFSSWSQVKIHEGPLNYRDGVLLISHGALKTPDEYAARFNDLLNQGHSWINLNAVGIVEGTLLVGLDLPSYKNSISRDKVSVNLSGPAMINGKPQCDLSEMVRFID